MQLALLFLFIQIISAFDMGFHHDLTLRAASEHGFNSDAANVILVHNWYTDFYSKHFLYKGLKPLSTLHFDNLLNSEEIAHYWVQFAHNARGLIQTAAEEKDTHKYLAVIGHTVHAVQDFYTHSNWNTFFPRDSCDCFRNETIWNFLDGLPEGLYTGAWPCTDCDDRGDDPSAPQHGGMCEGVNKDSYARAHWDESYIFGYHGAVEWFYITESWASEIDDQFALDARNFIAGNGFHIDQHLEFMRGGSWKGPGNSEWDTFTPMVRESVTFNNKFRSMVYDILPILTKGLYEFSNETTFENETIIPSDMPHYDNVVVQLRIFRFETFSGQADMYPKVTIDGAEYVDNTISDTAEAYPEWTTLAFIPRSTEQISITISLYDEDFLTKDDLYDINPQSSVKNITFTYMVASQYIESSTFRGVYNTIENGVSTVGNEGDIAALSFYVTTFNIGSCGVGMSPESITNSTMCRVPNPELCTESSALAIQISWISVILACIFVIFQ